MIDFFQQQLQHNPFFITAACAGVVSAFVIYFKDIVKELFGAIQRRIIFTACIYQNDPLFSDFEIWFYAHYSEKYRNVEATVNEVSNFNDNHPGQNNNRSYKVFFKQSEGVFIIWFKRKMIVIRKKKEKMEHATDIKSVYFSQYDFYAIRGAGKVRQLMESAVEFSSKKAKQNELKIYTHTLYGDWYVSSRISSKNISGVIINESKKAELIADMDTFMNSKAQYERRCIFYKRGYGFHGDPGNGKTSLALSMGTYMNRDIYCLDLNSLSENSHLKTLFVNMPNNALLLVEDIDGFFYLREPVKKDSKISYSTFLNCIDGANYKEGLVVIITTNKRESLDPALIRSGRIDFMFEVPKPGIEQVADYLKIFYDMPSLEIEDCKVDISMCDIQAICLNNKDNYLGALDMIKSRSMPHLKLRAINGN